MNFEDIYNQSQETDKLELDDVLEDQVELENYYYDLFTSISDKFPECEYKEPGCGDEDTEIRYIERPLEDGLGWTQIDYKNKSVEKVLISNLAISLDDVHFASVVAHEAAHVAAFNYILNTSKNVEQDLADYKKCGGHTVKWHEIVDWMNRLKDRETKEKGFDIVEKIDEESIKRYFPD